MPERSCLKGRVDLHRLADRAADHRFDRGPCAKNFNQSVNSFDLEDKPVSQSILASSADPLQLSKTTFERPKKA
jgi:hypothetical protein